MKKYRNFTVVYRRQGYPNAALRFTTVQAANLDMAEMLAHMDVSENFTILSVYEEEEQ